MNPSTASGRLVKDILYKLIVETGRNKCHVCSEDMSRATFSIEHKTAWLDSGNPLELYFDLDNISFSHLSCNISSSRPRPPVKYFTPEDRAVGTAQVRRAYENKRYNSEVRRERYLASKNKQ